MSADDFFSALRSYWAPVPEIKDSFLAQSKEFIELEQRLRQDEGLAAYDHEVYPELRTLLGVSGTGEASSPRAALHLCTHQLQLMENVYVSVNLRQHHAHPLNRGWMNLFRRWTNSPTLRLLWPSLKSLYSKDFVTFAEYQLNLSGMLPAITHEAGLPLPALFQLRDPRKAAEVIPPLDPYQRLFTELGHEWPLSKHEKASANPKGPLQENYALYFDPFPQATAAWTISHPSQPKELWGIALLAPHVPDPAWPESVFQASDWLAWFPPGFSLQRLMLWIRPAFRGIRLGTMLLDRVFVEIGDDQALGLIVVLPPLRRDQPGYGDEMAGWLRFYERKGFVRMTADEAQRLLSKPFDPAAFCLVVPEFLDRLSTPRGTSR